MHRPRRSGLQEYGPEGKDYTTESASPQYPHYPQQVHTPVVRKNTDQLVFLQAAINMSVLAVAAAVRKSAAVDPEENWERDLG